MIVLKITTGKIDKNLLFKGEKGTYLDLALMDNKAGRDEYGNDGFVVQSVSKADREAGKKGPIVGNWKRVGEDAKLAQRPAAAPTVDEDPLDVPF